MYSRSINLFRSVMKTTDRLAEDSYKATTAKRLTVVIPKGMKVFDTDLDKWFVGDGSTYGGISDTATISNRKIPINTAGVGGGLSADATTDRITWTASGAYLRTGDAVTLAAGGGTLPSGLSATTYWVYKDTLPASDSFKVSTSKANAASGVCVDILSSGVAGYTAVVNTVCVQGFEDILLLSPVAAAVDVCLPYPSTANDGFSVTVKRAAAGSAVTLKMLDVTGGVGTLTLDGTAANVTLASGSVASGVTVMADGGSNGYFKLASVV